MGYLCLCLRSCPGDRLSHRMEVDKWKADGGYFERLEARLEALNEDACKPLIDMERAVISDIDGDEGEPFDCP